MSVLFSERSMVYDERLSDMLSKWERLSRSGAVRDLRLVFKVSSDCHKRPGNVFKVSSDCHKHPGNVFKVSSDCHKRPGNVFKVSSDCHKHLAMCLK